MTEIFIKIYGQVHGVGFRYETKKAADQLKLVGFVRNAEDGTVEIVAQGQETEINDLLLWLKTGAPGSVEKVEVEWSEPSDLLDNFQITD